MHWAVVGGAASVGKGRPGPISRKNESEREREKDKEKEREEDEGPIWTRAVRNVQIQMLAERKKEVHTRTNTTQHCSRVKKGDKKGKEQQKEVVGFFCFFF